MQALLNPRGSTFVATQAESDYAIVGTHCASGYHLSDRTSTQRLAMGMPEYRTKD